MIRKILIAVLLFPALVLAQPSGEIDPYSIWLDGTSTTTARIPFAVGWSQPDNVYSYIGSNPGIATLSTSQFNIQMIDSSTPDGFGGTIRIRTAAFTTGDDSIIPGSISFTAGSYTGAGGFDTSSGGGIAFTAGSGGVNSGGSITVRGGASTSGIAGGVNFIGGSSAGAFAGGSVIITAGNNTATGAGGSFTLSGGANNGTAGNGGSLSLMGGNVASGGSGDGGSASITAGSAKTSSGGTSGNGGSVSITAGGTNNAGLAGNIVITAGAHSGSGAGGIISLLGGTSTSGNRGYTRIGTSGAPDKFSLASANARSSLYVNQALEVDGVSYFDGGITTTTLNLTADSNQIILDSDGTTTTLTDSATSNRVITFPDGTTTLGGLSLAQTWSALNTYSTGIAAIGSGGTYNSTVRVGDVAFSDTGPAGSTNAGGIQLTNGNSLSAGLFMEVDEVLSYGINAAQIGSVDLARQGALFRMDARTTFPIFSVIMQDHQDLIGGGASAEYFPLQVSEQATVTIGAAAFEGEYDTQASLFVKQGLGSGYSIITESDIYSQGEIWIANSNPILYLVDSAGDDWKIDVITGSFRVSNTTDAVVPLIIDPTTWRATFSNALRANVLEATATSAQIVFDAAGAVTTTLQDSAALVSKTITLPNVTATLAHTGSGSQTFAGAIALSSTLAVSGLATFNSTSGITLSSTSPMITFTDTSASEDDFVLATNSLGGFYLRNSTDGRTDFQVNGAGEIAMSANYAPVANTKLYVSNRFTDPASGAGYAFQANIEINPTGDWAGSNMRGFAGGAVYTAGGFDFNNGATIIGLDGLVQAYLNSGDTVGSMNGVFGEASIDGATTGGTVSQLSAVGTFINIQRAATVTIAYLFRASGVQLQTSGTVGTIYAFYDTGQTAATTNNWGFYGLTAKNYLSGDLYFGQTDGAERIESTADNLLDFYAGTTHNFNVAGAIEAVLTANRLTFNNGSNDSYLDWATDGTLVINSVTDNRLHINGSLEATVAANLLTFENGATDTSLGWGTSGQLDITAAALTTTGTLTSSGSADLGWAVVDGTDDTACTSQCTSAAVFGLNLAAGATAPVIVGATDATADICLCAGAS